jgi:peroxiredoxin
MKTESLFKKLAATAIGAVLLTGASGQTSAEQAPTVQAELAKARQFSAQHRYRDAEKSLKLALRLSQDNCRECYMSLTSTYWSMGDDKAAFQNLDRAFAISSTNDDKAEVRTIRGNLLLGLHDASKLKDAEAEYHAALGLSGSFPTAHYGLGVSAMRQSRDDEGKRELQTYLDLLPDGVEAKNAQLMIANPRRARERFAPEFTATGLHGEQIALKNYAGKIVVLDFWATWCGPCVASVGDLKELVKKYPADKLVLISISADRSETPWRDFIERKQMNWTHIFDRDGQIADDFKVHAFPTYMVIDGEGVIREQIVGEDSRQSVAYRLKDKLKAMPELKGN